MTIKKPHKFSKLYDMSIYTETLSKIPLYDGATISVMDALVKYFSWFSEHPGISKEALSDVLSIEHNEILPAGNKLPSSYNEAIKFIEPFLIEPVVFYACPNDCVIFRKQFTDLKTCPVHGSSRFNSSKKIFLLPHD